MPPHHNAPHWGLPEAELLGRVRPLASVEGIDTLDWEGLFLHAMVHDSQHCFSHGLRAAWDILAILRSCPGLDWERLAHWVAAMRAPRGFWVPVAVLSRELGLPVPRDALERDLEAVARRRLFRVAERVDELDPLSRHALCSCCTTRWAPGRATSAPRPAGRWCAPDASQGRPGQRGPTLEACAGRGGISDRTAGPSRAPWPTRTDPGSWLRPWLRPETERVPWPCFSCQRATPSPVVNQTSGKRRM